MNRSLQRLRRLILPHAPEIATAESRSIQRHRRALLSGATGLTAKAINVGIAVVTVPITLRYLGNERFGLWMAISAVFAMAAFADFGIGNGVLNAVSTAFGRDDIDGIRRAISSGFAVLTAIAVFLLAIFFTSYRFVDWSAFFRVTSAQGRAEAGPAIAVFFTCFALNIPVDIVQRVQLGLQQGFRTNLWQVIAGIMSLVALLAAIEARLGLPWLVAALAGIPLVGVALNAVQFFFFSRRDLLPGFHFVSIEAIRHIARLGGLFFVLQLVGAISVSADNFIVARVLGANAVSGFSVPQRLFTVVATLLTMLLTPFWPAYGEAAARNDRAWIARTLRRTLFSALAFSSIASLVLLIFSNAILRLWVGPQIHATFWLMLGLAAWSVLNCCSITLGVYLNGTGVVRFQIITASIFGIACLALKVLFVHIFGIGGVPWATTLAFIAILLPAYLWYIPRLLRRTAAQAAPSALPAAGSDARQS